jgi:hypothetical protein
LWPRASQRENKDQADGRTYYSALTRAATRIIPADVIKVSIYRTAEMMRVKLCEAAHITANPLAFSLGCAVDKDGNLVQESPIPIVAQA